MVQYAIVEVVLKITKPDKRDEAIGIKVNLKTSITYVFLNAIF